MGFALSYSPPSCGGAPEKAAVCATVRQPNVGDTCFCARCVSRAVNTECGDTETVVNAIEKYIKHKTYMVNVCMALCDCHIARWKLAKRAHTNTQD